MENKCLIEIKKTQSKINLLCNLIKQVFELNPRLKDTLTKKYGNDFTLKEVFEPLEILDFADSEDKTSIDCREGHSKHFVKNECIVKKELDTLENTKLRNRSISKLPSKINRSDSIDRNLRKANKRHSENDSKNAVLEQNIGSVKLAKKIHVGNTNQNYSSAIVPFDPYVKLTALGTTRPQPKWLRSLEINSTSNEITKNSQVNESSKRSSDPNEYNLRSKTIQVKSYYRKKYVQKIIRHRLPLRTDKKKDGMPSISQTSSKAYKKSEPLLPKRRKPIRGKPFKKRELNTVQSPSSSSSMDKQGEHETRVDVIQRRKVGKLKGLKKPFVNRKRYSKEEDYAIIRFIIDKNLVEFCTYPSTFDTIFQARILNKDRTSQSMMSRMIEHILTPGKMLEYKKYGLKKAEMNLFKDYIKFNRNVQL